MKPLFVVALGSLALGGIVGYFLGRTVRFRELAELRAAAAMARRHPREEQR